ncbi:lactonase family protein [Novosphingobium resinovorum]
MVGTERPRSPKGARFKGVGKSLACSITSTEQPTSRSSQARKRPTGPAPARSTSSSGFAGERSASELAISADGTILYLTDRGENTIVVHAIDPETGKLTFLQRIACGGEFPWHFAIAPSGSWMLVANERSNRIEVFSIDAATGHVAPTRNGLDMPRPVHILFAGEIA